MLDQFKTVGMLFAFLGASTGTASAFTPYNTLIHSDITQQDGVCKGVVKDNQGETVIGASVVVKGSTNGTITGLDGDFTLNNVKRGDVIQISYIGYVSQEVVWQGTPLNITLKDLSQKVKDLIIFLRFLPTLLKIMLLLCGWAIWSKPFLIRLKTKCRGQRSIFYLLHIMAEPQGKYQTMFWKN